MTVPPPEPGPVLTNRGTGDRIGRMDGAAA